MKAMTGNAGLRLVAYVRVSSTSKADHEPSAAEQLKEIRRWARAAGHKLAKVCADKGVSGSNGIEDREALTEALAFLRAGKADGLAFAHMDRLSRKLTVQEGVLAAAWALRARVFSADTGEVLQDDDDDPMRTAMRQMMGVFAQLERGMIRARLNRGKRAAAAQGRYTGGFIPLGQRAEGGRLVADPSAQAAIARMRELRAEGKSLRQITAALDAEGFATVRGGRWQASTVARVLAREAERRPECGSAA